MLFVNAYYEKKFGCKIQKNEKKKNARYSFNANRLPFFLLLNAIRLSFIFYSLVLFRVMDFVHSPVYLFMICALLV